MLDCYLIAGRWRVPWITVKVPVIQRCGRRKLLLLRHSQDWSCRIDWSHRIVPMRITAWMAWRWLLDPLSRAIMVVSTPGSPRRDRTNQNLLQPPRGVPTRGCCLSKRLSGCYRAHWGGLGNRSRDPCLISQLRWMLQHRWRCREWMQPARLKRYGCDAGRLHDRSV